jgi:rhodanese-related sulfurtransferase
MRSMGVAKVLKPDQLIEFNDAIEKGRCLLLDVREGSEYEVDHIHSAMLRPLSQLDHWIDQLDKNAAVIVYCRTGKRSLRCAEVMISKGFREVYLLEGGFDAFRLRRGSDVAHPS